MKVFNFVKAEDMSSLEEYGASLISCMLSLKTLELYHLSALKKGLLDEDERETAKTICWEISRLMGLYKTQIEHVVERTDLSEEEVLQSLRNMVPDIKIPRKKIKKDE